MSESTQNANDGTEYCSNISSDVTAQGKELKIYLSIEGVQITHKTWSEEERPAAPSSILGDRQKAYLFRDL